MVTIKKSAITPHGCTCIVIVRIYSGKCWWIVDEVGGMIRITKILER